MFKKLIAFLRNGGVTVMHLMPLQPQGGVEGGPVQRSARATGVQGAGRTQALWEIPACQRQARSGDRVLRQF